MAPLEKPEDIAERKKREAEVQREEQLRNSITLVTEQQSDRIVVLTLASCPVPGSSPL